MMVSSLLCGVALPLLRTHGHRAIGFVVVRVPECTTDRARGLGGSADRCARRRADVGSHSLYHHHVPVAHRIIGFVGPRTPIEFTADFSVPDR